jgi:hypothetical protein
MVATPHGDEAMIYGTSKIYNGLPNTTYWWVDASGIFAGAGLTFNHVDPRSNTKTTYFESIDFTGSPIVLGTHNFIARSRAHTGWSFGVTFGGIHDVTYSSEAYWSYTLGKNNLYNHEIVCGIDEVDRPKLRITVSRDGKSMAMIGLQSTSLGAPDSTRLYIRNIERDTLVETSAADGWVSIDNIALMNI